MIVQPWTWPLSFGDRLPGLPKEERGNIILSFRALANRTYFMPESSSICRACVHVDDEDVEGEGIYRVRLHVLPFVRERRRNREDLVPSSVPCTVRCLDCFLWGLAAGTAAHRSAASPARQSAAGQDEAVVDADDEPVEYFSSLGLCRRVIIMERDQDGTR
jgi:hypothetical protein